MVRVIFALLALMAIGAAPCISADRKPLDEEFLRGFMAGEYDLIGRLPDSGKTYSGHVTFRESGKNLEIVRTINGKTVKAVAKFETIAGADRIPVLRMHFTLGSTDYEATYIWQSDPDNYPRFTGWVYLPGNHTKAPGLEALFPARK